MFLLMPPIRKNLFAIYTKICYDCIRGIQQGVETSVESERWLHRRPAKSGSAVLKSCGFRSEGTAPRSFIKFPLSGSVGARCR